MARKRMFRLDVLETDAFMDMPLTTQALYFHLNMRADDDGFIGNPNQIVRAIGASSDDLKLLVAKRFVLTFADGVIVIKHWRLHNTLSANRYKETNFIEDKAMLRLKDNKAYTFNENGVPLSDGHLIEVSLRQTKDEQRRTKDEQKTNPDKNSIGKNRIEKISRTFTKPTVEEVRAYCKERNNKVDPEKFVDFYESKGWMVGRNHMRDWKSSVRTWEKKDAKQSTGSKFNNFEQREQNYEELERLAFGEE